MNILIVEDDASKCLAIYEYIRELIVDVHIEIRESVHEGTKAIFKTDYDLVVIDMSLTTFTIGNRNGKREAGGRPQGFGGREVLRFMKRKRRMIPAVVITQFEKFGSGPDEITLGALEQTLMQQHGDFFLGIIYYNATSAKWKTNLKRLVIELGRQKRSQENG